MLAFFIVVKIVL